MRIEVAVNPNYMIECGLEPVSRTWLIVAVAELSPAQRNYIADRFWRGRILARPLSSYQGTPDYNKPGALFTIGLPTKENFLHCIDQAIRTSSLTFPSVAQSTKIL